MSTKIASRMGPLAAAAVAVALLSGCGANAEPDPVEAGGAPSSPSGEPAGSPTPGETEGTGDGGDPDEPGAPVIPTGPEPVAVLPLACAELASPSQVQAGFHQTVSVKVLETSPPPTAARADFAQAGGLYCAWGGSASSGLQVGVIGDAAANYAQRVAAQSGSGFRDDTFGDDSHVKCTVDGQVSRCSGDILVGDYWVAATATDSGGAATESAAFAAFTTVISPVIAHIAEAGPALGRWQSPTANGFSGDFLCADPRYPAAALSSGTNGFTVKNAPRNPATQGGLMSSRVSSVACAWKIYDRPMVGFSALDGGAWVVDRMVAAGVGTAIVSDFDAVRMICTDRCTGWISYFGALVVVSWEPNTSGADDMTLFVQELAYEMGA